MLDLAKHIVTQKKAHFEPEKFEDHYEEALSELIKAKRQRKAIAHKARPRGENVVDLMDALKKSLESTEGTRERKHQPLDRKRRTQKRAAKAGRSTARRKAG
jgi:DNA end-binding protein Ku